MFPERSDVSTLSRFRYTPITPTTTPASNARTRRRTSSPTGITTSSAIISKADDGADFTPQDIAALHSSIATTYPTTPALRESYRTPNTNKRVSPHHWAVYDATLLIPSGKVTTYKALSIQIGAGSPRSVGGALRNNPFAPWVPCHRVVATDLFVGGFKGEWKGRSREGKEMKAEEVTENWHEEFKGKGLGVLQCEKLRLLRLEGVPFDPATGKLVDPDAHLWTFSEGEDTGTG